MLKEFKDFLMKGNLIEIAVGLILALAFKAVVDEVVNIINQIIAFVLGSTTPFSQLAITSGSGADQKSIVYGGFLNALFAFIVVGFVLFLVVKAYNKSVAMSTRGDAGEETEEDSAEVALLKDIRDALRQRG